jgi:hypothetical protein
VYDVTREAHAVDAVGIAKRPVPGGVTVGRQQRQARCGGVSVTEKVDQTGIYHWADAVLKHPAVVRKLRVLIRVL